MRTEEGAEKLKRSRNLRKAQRKRQARRKAAVAAPKAARNAPSVRKDKYPNFKALEAAEKRGEDYAIDSRRVDGSPVAIIAPHGGNIEPLTDTIANRIAGR